MADPTPLEKTILGTFKSLLTSQKVQFFLISQVVTFIVLYLSTKLGIDPKVIEELLFMALGKAGLESVMLTSAHAKVDAQVSAAKIHANANESIAMQALQKGVLANLPSAAGAALSLVPTPTPTAAAPVATAGVPAPSATETPADPT